MDAAAEVAGVQPRPPGQRGLRRNAAGDLAPLAQPAEDRRPASGHPGHPEAGPERVTCLVDEGNGASLCGEPPYL